jgi:hypothetical protein
VTINSASTGFAIGVYDVAAFPISPFRSPAATLTPPRKEGS